MFETKTLSEQSFSLFLAPIDDGLIEPDYDSKLSDFGIGTLALERSLFIRTARLLAWRMAALKNDTDPREIRRLEGDVRWPFGRALSPSTDENPLGVPESFLSDDPKALRDHLELLLNDYLYTLTRATPDDWVGDHLGQAYGLDDETSKSYLEEFKNSKEEELGKLNVYLDELAKENAFYEIDANFVGMGPIKKAIWKLYQSDRFSAKARLGRESLSMHMAFVGARGKGKTTVVPAVATAMKNLGLIEKDTVKSISLNKLAGTTLGADDVNLRKAFEAGKKGVVFIDEVDVIASYLAQGHNRAQLSQAINEKMEEMRKHTCVIVAAYPEHIDHFLDSDQGLRSRFGDRVIYFPEYKTSDLVRMFEIEMKKAGYRVEDDDVRSELWEHLSDIRKNHHKDFADGRTVREFIQALQAILQQRLSADGHGGIYSTKPLNRKNTYC